jgi:hypothetical protein
MVSLLFSMQNPLKKRGIEATVRAEAGESAGRAFIAKQSVYWWIYGVVPTVQHRGFDARISVTCSKTG